MPDMKKYIPYAIIAVLLIILWFKGCDKTEPKFIEIPAKEGKFDTVYVPVPVKPEKEYVYKWRTETDTIEKPVPYPVNQQLIDYYNRQIDKRDSLYADAIGEREYNIKQEDSLLITNNYIKAQGKVLAFQQDYTIKPQKVAIKQKETALRLLGGIEIGNTKEFNNFSAKANLMLQNSKGNIITFGADTEQLFYVGYSASIFNIKK